MVAIDKLRNKRDILPSDTVYIIWRAIYHVTACSARVQVRDYSRHTSLCLSVSLCLPLSVCMVLQPATASNDPQLSLRRR